MQLPSLKARQVIKALERLGFEQVRQKGSHVVLRNSATKQITVVPNHPGRDIKKPLLRKIIEKDAGISIQTFLKNL